MRFERHINFNSRRSTMEFRPRTYASITAIVAAFSMVVFFYTPVVAAEPPYFHLPTQTIQGDPEQWSSMEDNIIFANDTQAIIWSSKDPDAVNDGGRLGIAHSYISYRAVGQPDWSAETETIFISSPAGFIGTANWVYPIQYIGVNGVYEIKISSEDADGFRCEEVYTIQVGDIDSDQDGYADVVDNCPATPNGHLAGTCYNYYTQESWGSCMTHTECQGTPAKWYTWCDTFQGDLDENGLGDVCEGPQDSDEDGYDDYEDNCPGTPNPGQQDADADGIGDACDEDTIYGYISGEFKEGIEVNIAIVTGSMPTIIATLITDQDGYYSIGDLEANLYEVSPEYYDYIFLPNSASVQIEL